MPSRSILVPEVALAGEHHRQAVLVGGGDRPRASRTEPPGWMTAAAPALAATSTPSRNGKNASEATHRARQRRARLRHRDAHRVDARHLAGADAQRAAAGGEHDGVRLDVLADAPGEVEIAQLVAASAARFD